MNVCEILRVKEEIDEKKRRLMAEYFKLDSQSSELDKQLKTKHGY